jgi:hypothetical protein
MRPQKAQGSKSQEEDNEDDAAEEGMAEEDGADLAEVEVVEDDQMTEEEKKAAFEVITEQWREAVKAVEATPKYKAHLERYEARIAAETAAISSVFAAKTSTTRKEKGWAFDGSVVTDGVSVSLQYSKVTMEPVKKVDSKGKYIKPRKPPTEVDHNYDKNLPTMLMDSKKVPRCIVLGVDPGRANIATVAYVLDDATAKHFPEAPRKKSWSLSRGAFYDLGKIRKFDKQHEQRFQGLKARFEGLGADGGSVRTVNPEEIKTYLKAYAEIREEWWGLALRRRESRDSLQRYAGKRGAVDSFFSRVKKDVNNYFPKLAIKVGYGHCVTSMKPTGKGEIAVPTTAAYKSCKRVFEPENVSSTDEYRTTVTDWGTGCRKEAVYRMVSERAPEVKRKKGEHAKYVFHLGHTALKSMPTVPQDGRDVMNEYAEGVKSRRKRQRRGGSTFNGGLNVISEREGVNSGGEDNVAKAQKYPEVRGLRFCPETRMYLDRDRESAVAIARLRTLELMGKARPAPFHRSTKATKRTICIEEAVEVQELEAGETQGPGAWETQVSNAAEIGG